MQEIAESSGFIPPALLAKPDLDPGWNYPFYIWQQLKGSRVFSQGVVNELPYSEFATWAVIHKLSVEAIDCLWSEVHLIDKTWVSSVREQLAKDAKSKAPKSADTPRAGSQVRLPQQERVSVSVPMVQR